ncbi:MAG TPA: PAS domain-containing sensor histidine kinase, partial [Pseudonocardia sp.]|nr:PAS domain-containing sensor histidine kinase [Pseudonocardia sp.]
MAAAVARCSRDLRYLWASREYGAWIGLTPEEIAGRPIVEILGGAAFDTLRPHFDRALRGERVEYEGEVDVRGLGRRWLHAVYVPTRDAGGVPDGWVGVVTDVTRRHEIEDMLRESDRRKDEFLAMLAHELRNPLAPISNAVGILKACAPPDPSLVRAREIIERKVKQLARLVDGLLDLSRITFGKIELQRQRVSLATIVRDAVDTARPLADERRHALTVDVGGEPIVLYADPARLVQVLENLLTNAIKFTPPGGRIAVVAERAGSGEAVVRVADDGVGVAPEMRERIFEPLVQEDRT